MVRNLSQSEEDIQSLIGVFRPSLLSPESFVPRESFFPLLWYWPVKIMPFIYISQAMAKGGGWGWGGYFSDCHDAGDPLVCLPVSG